MNKEDVVCVCVCVRACSVLNEILVIKKNEIVPFAATWMDMKIIILSEVSQRKTLYDITNIWN